MFQSFLAYIKENHLFGTGDRLLIAVSGGVDSVVLCDLCARAGLAFSIAHCNFSLRGAESDRDETFVRHLAEHYQVPFFLQRFDTAQTAADWGLSIQETARKLRYDWFAEVVNGQSSKVNGEPLVHHYLLTAHHRDDNIETVLMNFFKGTGISGLRGIRPKAGNIVRPLLFAGREEVEAYAAERGLEWVHDSSNDETKYTRNYLRHTVLPAIEQVYPQVRQNLASGILRFTGIEAIYREAVEKEKKRLLEVRGTEVHIPVLKLAKSRSLPTLVYEIISGYGFTHRQVDEVLKLLQSETGKYIDSPTHRLLRNRAWLIIAPLRTEESGIILIDEGAHQLSFGGKTLTLQQLPAEKVNMSADPAIALLDAREIRFPLLLRKWKAGDYFYPLGLRKKKKLSRFFIDQRLSRIQKEDVWVLESDKRIAWVLGLRIDDRFKVVPGTREVWRLEVR
ncbi:tRNA lysidine(34) synthetase TilS [Paraflavisolibacter sp. H34]|uniref:tRNA lysidine(34) synthetase TilS n=1 Tax=Huijunlia imazamoxiresistens TaxID=3127457 RepID=UPI0030162E2B